MRHLMIIINPIAGAVKSHGMDDLILQEAAKLTYSGPDGDMISYEVDPRYTRYAGHASELAREAVGKNYYGVLACGGDGTINEVAAALCDSEVALGIIPLGSGNGLARHLGIPITVKGAMKVIAEDRLLHADYATANGHPFFCTFGVGFDAEVTDRFNKLPGRGLKNYIRTAINELFKYKSETYTIVVNGRHITEHAWLVAVCNASQYGNNAYIAPNASIKDGRLDITVMHDGNLIENAVAAIEMLSGLVGKTANFSTFQAESIKIIRSGGGVVHFDGEAATLDNEIDVKCHRGGLIVFSTAKKTKMRAVMAPQIPILSPLILTMRDLRFKIFNLFQ